MSYIQRLKKQLIEHEGYKKFPYKCSEGYLTIGIGHNLDSNGLNDDIIEMIFMDDISSVLQELHISIPVYDELSKPRQAVLADMCFNLGINRLLKFKKFIKALYDRDYDTASAEMLDSRWARQVGRRAERLATQMKEDEWQ